MLLSVGHLASVNLVSPGRDPDRTPHTTIHGPLQMAVAAAWLELLLFIDNTSTAAVRDPTDRQLARCTAPHRAPHRQSAPI